MNSYYVYLVECSDKTFYTGWNRNIEERIQEHNNAKCGAQYTLSRLPIKLVYVEPYSTLSDALKREAQIKKIIP